MEPVDPRTLEAVRRLLQRLERAHPQVYRHSKRVAAVMRAAAARLDLSPGEHCRFVFGALLHDVGKLALPARLLAAPRPLTPGEQARVRRHVHYGLLLVERALGVSRARPLAPFVFLHHERPDGNGYPLGLAGEQIPKGVLYLSVADAYVAMRERRPYRAPRSHDEALDELFRHRGRQFDPAVLDRMAPVLEDFRHRAFTRAA